MWFSLEDSSTWQSHLANSGTQCNIVCSCPHSHCNYPIREWLMLTYINIICIRSFFFFFEISNRFMKCSAISILFIILPFHTLWTILGSFWYSRILKTEPNCVSDLSNLDQLLVSWLSRSLAHNICSVSILLPRFHIHHNPMFFWNWESMKVSF